MRDDLPLVLVCDDTPAKRYVLSSWLRRAGYTVVQAETAAEALDVVRREPIDLAVLDVQLPDGSGLDVMRELRDRYAGRSIALTGYGMESDVAASRDAGFAEHLTKPVDLASLEGAIRRVSRHQR